MVKLTESIVCSRTKVSALEMVRKLNCWGCELDDIEILQQMPNVEVLSLSVNNIASLWPLSACTNLRELYLRKNNIAGLAELRHLRRLSKLRILWLSENPCADHPDYRYHVLRTLPALTTLDNRPVTAEELNSITAYEQSNGISTEDVPLTNIDDSYSSPECDLATPEFVNVPNGIGWKTVRLSDRQSSGSRRVIEVERGGNSGMESFAVMSASCYVPNVTQESNGYHTSRNDRRNTSTSMTSLYESLPERNTSFSEMTSWPQQQQRNMPSRNSVSNSNQSNILTAVTALLNELDKQGLESVINEAEQRLMRF